MAQINIGSIKFKWQGAYAGGTAYTVDDVVSYQGSSYICIQASTGNLPTNATYWEQMSSAGTNGTDGTDLTSTLTTQGDILYRDGSGLQRLGAGTSGQVLQTGGTGANPSWITFSSGIDHLQVTHITGQALTDGANTKITNWDTPLLNDFSSAWNSTNGEFTAPSNGSYWFSFHLATGHGANNTRYINAIIYKNGVNISTAQGKLEAYKRFTTNSAIDGMYVNATGIMDLTASDVISFYGYGNDDGASYNTSESGSRLSIMKLK